MLKKFFSLVLVTLFIATFPLTVALSVDEPPTEPVNIASRASLYLNNYSIAIISKGSGKMCISYLVGGTRPMDKIGAYSLKVEQLIGSTYYPYATYNGSDYPEFYAFNTTDHGGDFYFTGVPGTTYRVTLTAYAELKGGSDKGTPLTSNGKLCK